jgi:hypothetical protein
MYSISFLSGKVELVLVETGLEVGEIELVWTSEVLTTLVSFSEENVSFFKVLLCEKVTKGKMEIRHKHTINRDIFDLQFKNILVKFLIFALAYFCFYSILIYFFFSSR